MNILVDAARLLTNLGSFGQNFVGVGSSNYSGEYIGASVTSMGADAAAAGFAGYKMIAQARLAANMSPAELAEVKASSSGPGKGTSYILYTLAAVEVLEFMTGFGPPDPGDVLKDGAEQFTAVSDQLNSALPDDQWQGPASHNYADLDTTLEGLAKRMAELDLELADSVRNQAEWVTHMRLGFGILKDLLIVGFIIELVMRANAIQTAGVSLAEAVAFSIKVSKIGMALAVGMLLTLIGFSIANMIKADGVADEYGDVVAQAQLKGTPSDQSEAPEAAESRVSSIEDISASTSDMSAMADSPTSASVADRPKLASVAGGSGDERAPLRALAGEAETLTDGSPETPEVPETPDGATPSTPSMPSMAQLAQMSGQAAKLSGQASQHMNLVNQTVGQIQQLAQMGQQGQGAAAPAEEATLAGDGEGAGAALGTEAAERAPIDVAAVGAEQAREPRPVDRTV
jgi:hypothetical protein